MDTELHKAARDLSAKVIRVEKESDLYKINMNGETPFLTAVKAGNQLAMRNFCRDDLINKIDKDGRFPVYYIFTGSKDLRLFRQIIELGADINAKDAYGYDALYYLYSVATILDTDLPFAHQKIIDTTMNRLEEFEGCDLFSYLCKRKVLYY